MATMTLATLHARAKSSLAHEVLSRVPRDPEVIVLTYGQVQIAARIESSHMPLLAVQASSVLRPS